ncbi:MAG: HAMP domain-containing protein, partial [Myxococcota bacterium]
MPSYYARQPFSVVMPFVLVHLITVLTMAAGAAWVADRWSSPTLVFVAAALVGLGPGLLAVVQVGRRVRRVLHALIDGLHSLKEQDYNVRLATGRRDEFDSLAILFNALSASLREVHNDTYQKELLQDAVVQRHRQQGVESNLQGFEQGVGGFAE